jgi:hypothetical protein
MRIRSPAKRFFVRSELEFISKMNIRLQRSLPVDITHRHSTALRLGYMQVYAPRGMAVNRHRGKDSGNIEKEKGT